MTHSDSENRVDTSVVTKRIFFSFLTVCTLSMALAAPAHAAEKTKNATPILLSDEKVDWIAGSSEWIHLTWTTDQDIENVKVRVLKQSDGMTIEYPNGADHSALMVDKDLAANEIDFTALKVTTTATSKAKAKVKIKITWDEGGKNRSADGELKFSNKVYEGEDFAILTDEVTIGIDPAQPQQNWVEFAYKGLAPTTRDMQISAAGDLEAYHPQDTFTSLHHDQTLHAGEIDVARVWFDPALVPLGSHTILVTISYTDASGSPKRTQHSVLIAAV